VCGESQYCQQEMSETTQFSMLEEAVFNLEERFMPWNIQFEVETKTSVDPERLRGALVDACEAHPLARAERQPYTPLDSQYSWEITSGIDDAPLSVHDAEDVDLDDRRQEFYHERIDLQQPPPFRACLVRGGGRAGGDRLLLSVSHVPADGVGALRLTRSVCRAYREGDPEPESVDFETTRTALEEIRPDSLGKRTRLLGAATEQLQKLADRPSRLSTDGESDQEGWGFVHREVDADLAERLVDRRPQQASVNDLLLAALHLAIDRWNDDHGDHTRNISLLMPVNLRPSTWYYDVFGMYALFESVETRPRHRERPAQALERVVEQTTEIKERDRATAFLESLELVPAFTPVGLKRQSPALLRGFGRGLVDTAVLSNLGRVPEPAPRLCDDSPAPLWFSPPCWDLTPLAIGVVTVGDRIRLVFRHTYEALGDDAAAAFAETYFDALARVAEVSVIEPDC
jgi:NRPS condensation-like uncharacterized protein